MRKVRRRFSTVRSFAVLAFKQSLARSFSLA
jgi:hypothetical protein